MSDFNTIQKDGPMLTPSELAQEFKTTPQTINTWHREGVIPSVLHYGRVVRFNKAAVIDALARRKEAAH